MRTFGWIALVMGILSFIGAASAGHGVFGPCFFIALGAFLLYKSSDNEKDSSSSKTSTSGVEIIASPSSPKAEQTSKVVPVKEIKKESFDEIHAALTLKQKKAAASLVIFFAGFVEGADMLQIEKLLTNTEIFLGVEFRSNPTSVLQDNMDADEMIDTVVSITHQKTREFLLCLCYDLAKMSGKQDAINMVYCIAGDMGYSKFETMKLIAQYS